MSYESDLQILKIRIENYQQSKEEADRTAAKSSETINSTKQLLSEAQTRISQLEEKIQRADTESKTRQKEDVAVGVDFAIGVGVPVGVQTDFCKLIRSGHSNARRATKQLYS